MPQSPNVAAIAKNTDGNFVSLNTDADGNLLTAQGAASGQLSKLNITAATVVKVGAGRVFSVSVIVAGSGPGTVNDAATTGAAAASNEIAPLSDAAAGNQNLNGWPFTAGLVIVPGTGQTIAVTYE